MPSLVVSKPIDLCGKYWDTHYPTLVPAGWAAACVQQARSALHVPWAVTPPATPSWSLPCPTPTPDWVAMSAAGPVWVNGTDFTVSGGVLTFAADPTPYVAGRVDPVTRQAVLWCGVFPSPPPAAEPQPGGYAALVRACVRYADSPAFSADAVVEDVATTGRGYVIVTSEETLTLPPDDLPSDAVVVGASVKRYAPAGKAWRLVRVGPGTPSEDRIALPAAALAGRPGTLVFYNSYTALAVDTTQALTRVRFAVGGDSGEVDAFWAALEAYQTATGDTLAHALDLRATPFGEPTATDLPGVVNPADLVARLAVGGGAYLLVTKPDQYGPSADPSALSDYPAGPHAAVWEWAGGQPDTAPYLSPF